MPLPHDAFDPIGPAELAELTELVGLAGVSVADRLVRAVAGVGIAQLQRVTQRELATLRIALSVAASIR